MEKYFDLLLKKTNFTSENYDKWIGQQDLLTFLERTKDAEYIPVYMTDNDQTGILVHSFFIPLEKIKNAKDIHHERKSSCYDSFWSWGYSYNDGEREYKILQDEYGDLEPLTFIKSFDARHNESGKTYHELSQKLVQILGLHYVPHKCAYCIYDPQGSGELIEVVKILPHYKEKNGKRKMYYCLKKIF